MKYRVVKTVRAKTEYWDVLDDVDTVTTWTTKAEAKAVSDLLNEAYSKGKQDAIDELSGALSDLRETRNAMTKAQERIYNITGWDIY